MLQPYRRHTKACPHRAEGQAFTGCTCPVWAYGELAGKPFRQSLRTTDGAIADRILDLLEAGRDPWALPLDLVPPAPPRTTRAAIAEYLVDCRERNLADATLKAYRLGLGYLDQERPVAKLDYAAVASHRAARLSVISPATWGIELRQIRAFLVWCASPPRHWLSGDSLRDIRAIKPPKIKELGTLPFEPDEVAGLLAACDRLSNSSFVQSRYAQQRAKALVYVLLYSGLRISDVAVLKRSQLAPSGHLLVRILKNNVPLRVLLHPEAVAAIHALPAANPEFVFWTGNGSRGVVIRNLRRTVQRLGELAGVHAFPHRFRDTFAVELLTQGADIRTVQKLLGHKSVQTTERHYAHWIAAHQAILDAATTRLHFGGAAARPVLLKPLESRRRNA